MIDAGIVGDADGESHRIGDQVEIDIGRVADRHRPSEDYELRDYILSHLPEGASPKVYIWGFRPAVYFLCRTVGPSRFPYNVPMRANWSPPEWLENLRREVMADPPDFILVGRHDSFGWIVGDYHNSKEIMPEWMRVELSQNFERVVELKFIELWQRKGLPDKRLAAAHGGK